MLRVLVVAVPNNKICTQQPVYIQRDVSFVIDLNCLEDPRDIRTDENGSWIRKGSPVGYASVSTDG